MVEEVRTSPRHTEMAPKQQVEEGPNALCKPTEGTTAFSLEAKLLPGRNTTRKTRRMRSGEGEKGEEKGKEKQPTIVFRAMKNDD